MQTVSKSILDNKENQRNYKAGPMTVTGNNRYSFTVKVKDKEQTKGIQNIKEIQDFLAPLLHTHGLTIVRELYISTDQISKK